MEQEDNNRGQVLAALSTPQSTSLTKGDAFGRHPLVDKREFAEVMTPALSLVAPAGMGGDDRKAWLAAAFQALQGMPASLVRGGVLEAMRSADHPSKIVPIVASYVEVKSALYQLGRYAAPQYPRLEPERPRVSDEERAEVAGLMKGLAQRMGSRAYASDMTDAVDE